MRQHYKNLQVEEIPHGIITCTFNRPKVHNALNLEMVNEIRHLLCDLEARNDVRILIFTGAGDRAFVSGADIGELHDRTAQDALQHINGGLFRAIEQFSHPTIAAIKGFALGGGCELAMACDLRICGENSCFGQPEVSLGIIPGGGATYRLAKLVGLGRAKELVFTGKIIDAKTAHEIGLVNRVVPDHEVVHTAHELGHEITRNGTLAVRLAKLALNHADEMSTDAGLMLESSMQAILFNDEEKIRRMAAFLKKDK